MISLFILTMVSSEYTKSALKFVAAPPRATKLYTLTEPLRPYARSKIVPPMVTVATGVKGYPLADKGETPPNTPSQTMTSNRLLPLADEPRKVSYATGKLQLYQPTLRR